VFPPADGTECFLIATLNRQHFGQGGDGLTAYSAVHRTDFTFRSGVFSSFPLVVRHSKARLRPRQWNELSMALSDHRATYWINGQRLATCVIKEGDLPSTEVYVGLVSYSTEYRVRRFDISRDPQVLSWLMIRVITLHARLQDGVVSVSCTGMSGDELANLEVGAATQLLPETRIVVLGELSAVAVRYHEGHGMWYMLPSRTRISCRRRRGQNQAAEGDIERSALRVDVRAGTGGRILEHHEDGSVIVEFDDQEHKLWVREERVSQLKVRDDTAERLADFRTRLAAELSLMECDMHLALPSGAFLGEHDDAKPLRQVFGLDQG